ncbi:hypothetical protein BO94DRAFT_133822 [Aspergillus sclerotioniger CBS 115572]|uniref:Uncharacterized protein n=1 Tax=Aspergillus sclerotioniger CBS 115572 TaxID=1450535 RepID=A0A317XF88_9EURO|nr:hypothetical protein BO94DRAFT_133822 [Aspergillus sclerotioniger CBS 115572]PWY95698.1 hypothetical protein BO94DRAFT_133822 [Aspergillus sclerotioniger CBS 115572]
MPVSRSGGSGYSNGQASDSPQKSQTVQPGRLEERPGCAFMKRNESRDTDFYQIFPMEVDKDTSIPPPPDSKVLKDARSDKGAVKYHASSDISLDTSLLKSGHENTIAWGKINRDAASLERPEDHTDALNERSLYESNCFGSPEAKTAWKPPRPPKPRFLSDLDVADSRALENASLSSIFGPREGHLHHKRLLPDSPGPFSTPQGCSRSRIRLANRSILLQGMDYDARKQQRRPWTNPKPGPCRHAPRLPPRGPKTYFLKDDPSRPFPTPLPSIDNLPLRKDPRVGSQKTVNVHLQDFSDVFLSRQRIRDSTWQLISDCFEKALGWISHWFRLEERSVVSLSLVGKRSVKQPLHSGSEGYSFHVNLNWSIMTKPTANHDKQDMNLSVSSPSSDTVRLFQVDITVPILFLQVLARLGAILRSLMFSEAMAVVVQLLLRLAGALVLYVLEKLYINITIRPGKPVAA